MGYAYKLSICMMVKDEEKNLGRCLDALSPILEKPDVELIIVDTGSQDKTVDIAQKYTSKLYFHQWQGHFSNMRNITISYAKGEWILIMDADEVLLNSHRIYDLLNDKEIESFNTIIFKVKNYTSLGRKAGYTVLPQERVFRNDGSFRYEGSVHNQPKFKAPLYSADIYIDHFGYIFGDDKELREKKFKRTAGILKRELEKDPSNIYYIFQLARSYNAHGDKEEALAEIRKAYSYISGKDYKTKSMFTYIYSTYAQICCEHNEFNEALDICNEGITLQRDSIDLYYLMVYSLIHMGREQEAVQYYIKYLELVNNYDNLTISTDRSSEIHYLGEKYKDAALNFLGNQFYNKCEYNKVYEYINAISDLESKVPQLIKVLLKLEKYDELQVLFEKVKEEKSIEDTFILILETLKKDLTADNNRKIETLLSEGEGIYSLLNSIRICKQENREELVKQAISIADFNELPDFYGEILQGIDKSPRQVFLALKGLRKSKIKQLTLYILEKNENIYDYFVEYLTKENIRDNDYPGLKTYIAIAGLMLFKEAGKVKNQERDIAKPYYDIFKLYINKGIKYVSFLYSTEKLRLYYNTVEDDEDRFFIALHYAIEATKCNDYRSGIKYFKEAVKSYPYMGCYMNAYKDELFINGNMDNL